MSILRTPTSQPARDPSMPLKDPCSCCGLVEADTELSESSVRGFAGYAGLIGARFSTECWYKCRDYAVFADRIRARRAAPRMYGTMPDVLPEMLPAGTKSVYGNPAPERLVLGPNVRGLPCYMRESDLAGNGWCWPDRIDWSTVPTQEAEQSRPLTDVARELYDERAPVTCRSCSAPARPNALDCAYCAHREYGFSELEVRRLTDNQRGQDEARVRMLAADAREKPRVSAEARELALPHPWEGESE